MALERKIRGVQRVESTVAHKYTFSCPECGESHFIDSSAVIGSVVFICARDLNLHIVTQLTIVPRGTEKSTPQTVDE